MLDFGKSSKQHTEFFNMCLARSGFEPIICFMDHLVHLVQGLPCVLQAVLARHS